MWVIHMDMFPRRDETQRLNVLYERNWTKLVTEQLKRFERAVVESGRAEGLSSTTSPQWTFGGALLYSVTLLTTVGYGRLSPRTSIGKVLAIVYAFIGVPLMLLLLSALGSLLASGAKRGYLKLCCHGHTSSTPSTHQTVGYHKAPSSPCGKRRGSQEDCALIQIASSQSTPNNTNCKLNHHAPCLHVDRQEIPKRAIVATVRASHARGGCRQTQVRQMLADPQMCPQHSLHASPARAGGNVCTSDLEEAEEGEENEHSTPPTESCSNRNSRIGCIHNTPSRVPLIWRPPATPCASPTPPSTPSSPSVPTTLVIFFFVSYIGLGGAIFCTTSGWSFLDSVYFCFIALTTIGVSDKLPESGQVDGQVQMLACCVYLFLGLVVVAMCFSLVHEEVTFRCRQAAGSVGLSRH